MWDTKSSLSFSQTTLYRHLIWDVFPCDRSFKSHGLVINYDHLLQWNFLPVLILSWRRSQFKIGFNSGTNQEGRTMRSRYLLFWHNPQFLGKIITNATGTLNLVTILRRQIGKCKGLRPIEKPYSYYNRSKQFVFNEIVFSDIEFFIRLGILLLQLARAIFFFP